MWTQTNRRRLRTTEQTIANCTFIQKSEEFDMSPNTRSRRQKQRSLQLQQSIVTRSEMGTVTKQQDKLVVTVDEGSAVLVEP